MILCLCWCIATCYHFVFEITAPNFLYLRTPNYHRSDAALFYQKWGANFTDFGRFEFRFGFLLLVCDLKPL
mgnify:CR=1 FL=1